jgi:hypothetical protein
MEINELQMQSIENCLAAGHTAPFYVHGLKVCAVTELPDGVERVTVMDVATGDVQQYETVEVQEEEDEDLPDAAADVFFAFLDDETATLPDGYKLLSKVLLNRPGRFPAYRITVEVSGQQYSFDWEPA